MTLPRRAAAIECRDLTRRFGDLEVVSEVSFSIPDGSVLALLGHNGAGKTTTIRLLNGVLTPDSGSVSVLGLDPIAHGATVRSRTSVLTENAGVDDRLTPRENLEMTAALRGRRGAAINATISDLLERFDLGREADRECRGFSTGQRRRVALARALLSDPEVLFLDEPTSGLDPDGAAAVLALISEMTRERGRTVVLCTHFLDEADGVADYMAVMARGRLLGFGRPEELARERWPELRVDVEIDPGSLDRAVEILTPLAGIRVDHAEAAGLQLAVDDREAIPAALSALVGDGLAVYGTTARPRTLRDVYHSIHENAEGSLDLAEVVCPIVTEPADTSVGVPT